MARGMEFDGDVAEPDFFAITHGLRGRSKIVAIAQPHHVERFLRGEHGAMAGPGVVGMAVRDHRPLDRPHRVDMEAAWLAAQAGGNGHQDVLRAHAGLYRRSCVEFYPLCAGLTRAPSWNSCPRACFSPPAI